MTCPLHQDQILYIQTNPQERQLKMIHWIEQLKVMEGNSLDRDRKVAAQWVWGPWLEDAEDPSQERECVSHDHNKI